MLGDKKSDEPYSSDDRKLLQTIARQIAVARENIRLKERVDQDRRLRHDVLAHLETGHVNVLKECPVCGRCYDATATACPSDGAELTLSLPVERTIDGKYRLDRLIGKGGMGAVYEAADLRLARSVAVKIMLGRAFGDRQALRRFEREAQACARLTHPNIVIVYDYGAAGADGAYLVMELVQGHTLRHELKRRGHLPPAVAATWFEQICEGVAAAHQRSVVHRDLKPENVVIAETATGGEILKVLDFGLAKVRTASDEAASRIPARTGNGRLHGARAAQRRRGRPSRRRLRDRRHGRRGHRRTASVPRTNLGELLQVDVNDPVTLGGEGPSCGGSSRCCAVQRPAIRRCATGRSRLVGD